MEIIKPEEYAVSEWAGGKTTQLYIYPQGSEYAKRNFFAAHQQRNGGM